MTDRETIWNKGDFPHTPSKIAQKRSGMNFSFYISPDRTSADFHDTLMFPIPKDTEPEGSQNLLFLLLTVGINSNPEAADTLQSHTVYVAVIHPVPIPKTFSWNTGFRAHTPIREICTSIFLKVIHWLGKPLDQKLNRNIIFSWLPVDGNQEKTIMKAVGCEAHCCAPTCLFSNLPWALDRAFKAWENKIIKAEPPYANPTFFRESHELHFI